MHDGVAAREGVLEGGYARVLGQVHADPLDSAVWPWGIGHTSCHADELVVVGGQATQQSGSNVPAGTRDDDSHPAPLLGPFTSTRGSPAYTCVSDEELPLSLRTGAPGRARKFSAGTAWRRWLPLVRVARSASRAFRSASEDTEGCAANQPRRVGL